MKADAKAIKWATRVVWNEGGGTDRLRLKPRNAPMATKAEKATISAALVLASKLKGISVVRLRSREMKADVVTARSVGWAIAVKNGVNAERIAVVSDRDATSIRRGIRLLSQADRELVEGSAEI